MGLFDYQQYLIDQKLLSIRDIYLIKDPAGNDLGRIERKLLSIGPKYTFYDASGVEVGRIEGKVLAFRPTYNILDPGGVTIATIKMKLFTFLGTEYWFENAQGEEILRAKGNFLAYEYRISEPGGLVIAEISKKILSIRDSYSVAILSPNANRYLVLAAVTCIDACEHERR
jgi:uncharacterized protein YxjI